MTNWNNQIKFEKNKEFCTKIVESIYGLMKSGAISANEDSERGIRIFTARDYKSIFCLKRYGIESDGFEVYFISGNPNRKAEVVFTMIKDYHEKDNRLHSMLGEIYKYCENMISEYKVKKLKSDRKILEESIDIFKEVRVNIPDKNIEKDILNFKNELSKLEEKVVKVKLSHGDIAGKFGRMSDCYYKFFDIFKRDGYSTYTFHLIVDWELKDNIGMSFACYDDKYEFIKSLYDPELFGEYLTMLFESCIEKTTEYIKFKDEVANFVEKVKECAKENNIEDEIWDKVLR